MKIGLISSRISIQEVHAGHSSVQTKYEPMASHGDPVCEGFCSPSNIGICGILSIYANVVALPRHPQTTPEAPRAATDLHRLPEPPELSRDFFSTFPGTSATESYVSNGLSNNGRVPSTNPKYNTKKEDQVQTGVFKVV